MRAIEFWLAGLGFVQVGAASFRLLLEFLPKSLHFREAPLWSLALLFGSLFVHLRAAKALREGRRGGRPLAVALVVAWVLGSYVAINTGSALIGVPYPVRETPTGGVETDTETSHARKSLVETWQGATWPQMISHPHDFHVLPTGLWEGAEYAFLGGTVALAAAMLARLLARPPPLPPADPSDGRAEARRILARMREDSSPSPVRRALGYALALHLALMGVLTVMGLVYMSFQVLGRHT